MSDTIIICAIFGIFLIISFIIGARVGQKIVKGEEIKIALPNPIQKINEYRENKETKKELEILDIINENIDNYNGTGFGQKNIPR